MKKATIGTVVFGAVLLLFVSFAGNAGAIDLTPIEKLGKYIFFDEKLSNPPRQSCSSCHDPRAGWTFPISFVNKHQVAAHGANPFTVGTLKPPSNAYAIFIGPFEFTGVGPSGYQGGNFWNGRSVGFGGTPQPYSTEVIGEEIIDSANLDDETKEEYKKFLGPTADQALNPFLNPVEQNIQPRAVCRRVAWSNYSELFEIAWGEPCDCSEHPYPGTDFLAYEVSFRRIAVSLAAYQASIEINSFSSERDIALQRELNGIAVDDSPGKFPLVGLTAQENYGHDLFYGITSKLNPLGKNANCAACHSENPPPPPPPPGVPAPPNPPTGDTGDEPFQLYTENSYHNIGTPPNPEIPGNPPPNPGLAGHTGNLPGHLGLFKTPTLRNVDKRPHKFFTKAYTHNGWFKSLESIVHYYNTAFLGGFIPFPPPGRIVPYEETTAYTFGVTRCPEYVTTERDALKHNCWPAPEHPGDPLPPGPPGPGGPPPGAPAPGIPFLFGDLHLDDVDEAAIVAYLKTLTDTYTPKAPKPYK